MLNETFYINGTDMRTLGVYLQRPIRISGLVPIVEKVHVEGRNGDLIFPTGAYENREGRADCFALSPTGDVSAVITAVNALLMKSQGYVELKQSEDPTHFWKARITNGADIEQRLRTLNPFTIKFDIEPQHWVRSGKEYIEFRQASTLENTHSGITLPEIKAYGTGKGTFSINGLRIDFLNLHAFSTHVDCESGAIYSERGNESKNVVIPENEFPKLKVGENNIEFSGGITRIKIQPRWWDL